MGVNPDEVVALGAAVQGGVLSGDFGKGDILLLDVTPLSLGVETMGGIMTRMIERNTTIPTRKTEVYTTAVDGQPSVEIHVLQGEREMAKDNKTLGQFTLSGIPSAPRGVPQIEVTFDIDANGLVNVTAKDRGTGQEQKITITGSTTLSDSEVDQMVSDAETHAEEDKAAKEAIEVRNNADTLAYQTEKMLGELGDETDESLKSEVTSAIANLREALEGDDTEAIKTKMEALQEKSMKLGEAVYAQAQAAAEASGEGAEGAAEGADDTEDADFEVVEDDE